MLARSTVSVATSTRRWWGLSSRQLKTLKRIIILEGWTNSIGKEALREVGDAYREMLGEMRCYALEHRALNPHCIGSSITGLERNIHGFPRGLSRGAIEMPLEGLGHSKSLRKRTSGKR